MTNDLFLCLNAVLANTSNTPITEFESAMEKNEYAASKFVLGGKTILFRQAKITPKKIGLFVAIWKRNQLGITAPYDEGDKFDFMVIAVKEENLEGVFVFPKAALVALGIISTSKKEGKRGMRVYPQLESGMNKQALQTFAKQKVYFHPIDVI